MAIQTNRVCEFYAGKHILLTGATGFVGRVWLEKALRVLDFGKIYLLVRARSSHEAYERVMNLFAKDPVFRNLRECMHSKFCNAFEEKLVFLPGDLRNPFLGLEASQYSEISARLDLIVGTAATVDFEEPMDVALETNVYGSKNLLSLAKIEVVPKNWTGS